MNCATRSFVKVLPLDAGTMKDGEGWGGSGAEAMMFASVGGGYSAERLSAGGGGGDAFDTSSSGHGNNGEDGNMDRRRIPQSAFSTSQSNSEAEEEDEESEDDYGEASPSVPMGTVAPMSPIKTTQKGVVEEEEDDVPLAARIPSALRAQKTIRKQVQDERAAKKRGRTVTTNAGPAMTPPPHPRLSDRPRTAESPNMLAANKASTVIPSTADPCNKPFTIDELSCKLVTIQASGSPPAASRPTNAFVLSPVARIGSDQITQGGAADDLGVLAPSAAHAMQPIKVPGTGLRNLALRHAKSFHSDSRQNPEQRQPQHHAALGRHATAAANSRRAVSPRPPQDHHQPTLHPTSSQHRSNRTSEDRPPPVRRSGEADRSRRSGDTAPPVPPLPAAHQQRVHVYDLQRFNIVEVSSVTTAGDIIKSLHTQGALDGWAGTGQWMLFEMAQDMGMERPVRNYELVADVTNVWNKEKNWNALLVKRTGMGSMLSRTAIPSASPIHMGYVEYETKRGKWNKRWLELREHSLWVSKKDTGKDETFLCSLSNFDAYYVYHRTVKSPKPFTFAVKSTDSVTYFENKDDYLHVFSCPEEEGQKWVNQILLARSYVLHQERHVLFATNKQTVEKAPGLNFGNVPLARSGTRKASAPVRPTVKPYFDTINMPPMPRSAPLQPSSGPFEPGSLLARQS